MNERRIPIVVIAKSFQARIDPAFGLCKRKSACAAALFPKSFTRFAGAFR
jgi:hypothetical protein